MLAVPECSGEGYTRTRATGKARRRPHLGQPDRTLQAQAPAALERNRPRAVCIQDLGHIRLSGCDTRLTVVERDERSLHSKHLRPGSMKTRAEDTSLCIHMAHTHPGGRNSSTERGQVYRTQHPGSAFRRTPAHCCGPHRRQSFRSRIRLCRPRGAPSDRRCY